ncbi:MAG: hypothetical protein HY901_36935 [Deltaproteobacteria bacterium]|nr:hypothetical protein [Deltaproteobacteria bacterium]
METKTMLEKITTAIDQVVGELQPSPAKKRMPLGTFVAYAVEEIRKAAQEKPETAAPRLLALKASIHGAVATLAKLNAEDTESEKVQVEVLTAWGPSKSEGDKPMDDLTTAADQSEKEISPVAGAGGSGAFAENPGDLDKALAKLAKEIEGLRVPAKKSSGAAKTPGNAPWPSDMNTPAFRDGVRKAEEALTWGVDPRDVSGAKEE